MNPNDPRYPQNAYGPPQQQQQQQQPLQQWQQQQWPQQPYPPNPYAYAPPTVYAPQNDSEATTIFVLGIIGVTACGICAPIAWAKGSSYRKTCMITGTPPNGLATAGWIMGMVGTFLIGISILFMIVALVLGA